MSEKTMDDRMETAKEAYATLTSVDEAGNITRKELSYNDIHITPLEMNKETLGAKRLRNIKRSGNKSL